jgi:type I restriction enzyme S subunit
MSSEWNVVRLADVASVRNGAAVKQEFFAEHGTPLARVTNFTDSSIDLKDSVKVHPAHANKWKGHHLNAGDALVATVGSWPPNWASVVGKAVCIPPNAEGAIQNQNTCCVRALSGKANQRFIYYTLRSDEFAHYAANSASGSANQARLPVSKLEDFTFNLPSLEEQQSIADLLGALDDRISLLRETNATLEAIAQALFKSWFVDFDPVRAKMEGRTPEGMDEATAALFPDGFERSELGEVPRGWVFKPFGALLAHSIGGDWGSEQPEEKNTVRVAIIRGTDIPDLQSGRENRVPIRYTSEKKLSTRQLQDGDIVIEVSGGSKDQPTGRALYVTDDLLKRFDCPVEPASFCRLFRPVDRATGVLLGQHLRFIYDQGKTWEYQNQSTGIANFQTTHFLEKELVAVPPDSVLNVFSETVRALVDRTVISQIDELSHIRDTLLPRLISGQLQLPEVADAH